MTSTLPLFDAVRKHRANKRDAIVDFFLEHLGEKFPSDELHQQFGTSFRTRVSELNRDPESPITIKNKTGALADGREVSSYWAELRQHHLDLG